MVHIGGVAEAKYSSLIQAGSKVGALVENGSLNSSACSKAELCGMELALTSDAGGDGLNDHLGGV